MIRSFFIALLVIVLAASCSSRKAETKVVEDSLKINYSVRSVWPHDTQSFIEGLEIHNGELYESTGERNSWIGIVNIETGHIDKKVQLNGNYFGEGITIFHNKVYELTWQDHVGFVYSFPSFKKIKDFKVTTEGWGMTHDNTNLIMSDGTDKIHFLDTTTLAIVKSISVKDEHGPVKQVNELEYVDGVIYANVWQTDKILKIDATSGKVIGRLDLTDLTKQVKAVNPNADVLNGIAWHDSTKMLLVTGKYWPYVYVLKLDGKPSKEVTAP